MDKVDNEPLFIILMKKSIVSFMLFFMLIGCSYFHWSRYYPYSNKNPDKLYLDLPSNYEDCLLQFDTIFTKKIINYYRQQDISIASIELSKELGGFFINFWNLSYYREDPTAMHIYSHRQMAFPQVLDTFINDGISDPEAMIRVLFKCYHKKLNGIVYHWKEEIKLTNSYWISPKKGEGWVSQEMLKREAKILSNYHFQQLKINDTVDILYGRSPQLIKKTSDWYYVSGVIQHKILDKRSINVKLTNIQSEHNENYMIIEDRKIVIGDTLTDYCVGWLKRGTYYMNYHRNKEYREGLNLQDHLR